MEPRFFDNNATTPLSAEAKRAWTAAVDDLWLNPSSPYRAAARVHAHLQEARERLAGLFSIPAERLVFNSGATEGNNAIFDCWAATLPSDARVAVSPTEHPSVVEAAKQIFADRVVWLELDANGAVDCEKIPWDDVAALSVMAANNETGILNPWQRLAEVAAKRGIIYHCDASQWIGKLPLSGFGRCAFVTGCAHKFGGPRGVGFCFVPEGSGFSSLQGGAQESGRRAGTEDLAGILAMVAALEKVEAAMASGRDAFEAALPGFKVVGQEAERLWNTSLVIAPAHASARWIRGLEKRGFLVSSGAACATGKEGPSHVLAAMGVPAAAMSRVLRISSSGTTSVQDWMNLVDAIKSVEAELDAEAAGSNSKVISID